MSIRIGCLVIFVGLLTGCTSQDVWQADGEITPSSYNAPSETLGRTIGKLKRLVIIPGIFEYSWPFSLKATVILAAAAVRRLQGERP